MPLECRDDRHVVQAGQLRTRPHLLDNLIDRDVGQRCSSEWHVLTHGHSAAARWLKKVRSSAAVTPCMNTIAPSSSPGNKSIVFRALDVGEIEREARRSR